MCLKLYFEGQEEDCPIAYSKPIYDPPTIGLILTTSNLGDDLVEIITSFLVLENKYRMDEKAEYREMIHTAIGGFMVVG